MKLRTLLFAGLVALPACSKPNNVPALKQQAVAVPIYYQGQVEVLGQRAAALSQQLQAMPSDAPGRADAEKALTQANEELANLRALRQNVEKQAAELANKNDRDQLLALATSTADKYEESTTVASSDLQVAEGWLSYTRRAQAQAPAAVPPPAPEPASPPSTEAPSAPGQPAPAEAPKQ